MVAICAMGVGFVPFFGKVICSNAIFLQLLKIYSLANQKTNAGQCEAFFDPRSFKRWPGRPLSRKSCGLRVWRGPQWGGTLIKHIVMWNLRGETAQAKSQAVSLLKSSFESLRGRIPGLLHLEVGVDSSRIDYACDVVLYSEFESQAALDAYASHPEHLRVKQELSDMRIARHQVDYLAEPR